MGEQLDKTPKITPIPKPQIDRAGGRNIPGTRIINHMRTGEDIQEEWEKDHGDLDIPTYERNKDKKVKPE